VRLANLRECAQWQRTQESIARASHAGSNIRQLPLPIITTKDAMANDLAAVENRLWATADQLWANTGLKPSEFSTPVLGLIFLR
jgi:hypothetical protein